MKTRLQSLDQFRGITIFLMILVNHPGLHHGCFPILGHGWHGLTLADCVFPAFLFIMGTSVVLVNKSKILTEPTPWLSIAKRSLILIVLGLIHDNIWGLDIHRIPGVLQRIGICYFLVSVIYYQGGIKLMRYLSIFITSVFSFWYMAVGDEKYFDALRFIDGWAFGEKTYWLQKTFDPEGIVSTFTALTTVWVGMELGSILGQKEEKKKILNQILILAFIFLGSYFTIFLWIDINKQMWTTSFAMITGFICTGFFGLLYWLTDINEKGNFLTPFKMMGLNSIALYMGSEIFGVALDRTIRIGNENFSEGLVHLIDQSVHYEAVSCLIFAVFVSLFWMLVGIFAFKKNFFIKI